LLAIFPRLLAFLVRQRPWTSVVYCPTFSHLSGLSVMAARLVGRPVIVRVATEHDVRDFADGRSAKTRLFARLLRRASAFIAPSAAIRDELRRAGVPDARIIVQPNAVDVERFVPATPGERREAKRGLGLPPDVATIGTVARLVPRKGLDTLLAAFAAPSVRAHAARLLIVGSGPLAAEPQFLARDLDVEPAVMWAGLQRDPRPWLRAMDVFAFPSRLEGSPNAVLEAMASGVPVVATRIGGVVDLIEHEETGLLVPPDDAEALSMAVDRLLGDADLRAAVAGRARARVCDAFSLPTAAARLAEICLAIQAR
jgi:glycosyltransferase involved in cell wall biosynthesis